MTQELSHVIDVQVEESVSWTELEPLRMAALAVLVQQQVPYACEVAVVLSDDETLRELNRRFRGVDAPTDVLSFSNETVGPYAGLAASPRYLGDIVISLQRAQAQAEQVGAQVVQELQLLIVHGMLHLLGYDHADAEQKARMWEVQQRILQALGADIPLPE